jgi:hypothetical protein
MQRRWIGEHEHDAGASVAHAPTDRAEVDVDLPGPSRRDIGFAVDPSRVLRILLLVIAVLVVLSTVSRLIVLYAPDFPARDSVADFLYVDAERSLPTLFSTALLLVCALLCATIAHARRRFGNPDVRHWAILSAVFGVMALDEFGQLHEKSMAPLRRLLHIQGGPLWFAWVIPAMLALAVFGVFSIRFLRRLPSSARRGFVVAGLLFVGGAIGVEMLGAGHAADHPVVDVTYVAFVTAEETLEMVGTAVLLWTLLAYIPVGLPGARWIGRVAPRQVP